MWRIHQFIPKTLFQTHGEQRGLLNPFLTRARLNVWATPACTGDKQDRWQRGGRGDENETTKRVDELTVALQTEPPRLDLRDKPNEACFAKPTVE